jgi:hypothetical protein
MAIQVVQIPRRQSLMRPRQGLIAILDALGAAAYSAEKIAEFMKSRHRVLGALQSNAGAKAARGTIEARQVTTFTFNDTVLIVYTTLAAPTLEDVKQFCLLLRKFELDSLVEGILFRGSIALGDFYVNNSTNTVMGPAVTDAAAWYDKSEWIGINATPHATMVIQALAEQDGDLLPHLLLDYDIPMKDGTVVRLKAVNWPKTFLAPNLTPCQRGEDHERNVSRC